MIDNAAVELALKYLDECFETGKHATLVEMLEYVDYFDRVVLVLDEVNETLKRRPSVCAELADGELCFKVAPGRRELTSDELDRGIQAYHEDFWARYKKLTGRDPPDLKTLGSNWPR